MYKKAVYSPSELVEVLGALDKLGKYYTVHKRIQPLPRISVGPNILRTTCGEEQDIWYVTEVEEQSGEPELTEGAVTEKQEYVEWPTNKLRVMDKIEALIARPLSDFVDIKVKY